MRHAFFALLLLFAGPARAAEPSAADVQALRALAAEADAAWDAADAERMAALYTDGGTAIAGHGAPVQTGRAAIREYFRRSFAARQGVLRHVTEVRRLEALGPDHVLSDGLVRVERRGADGAWTTVRTFDGVSVVTRTPQGWRLNSVRAFPRGDPREGAAV